ncbi:MAG: helix-turn-helix domain-containing protein [Gammaproteobacteria bacterium]|nr:helix-turn-helix domain-containing protein [Gammaproteobacteria bacterium]MBQ0840595.1 helix-turn-helix domain-containing protein [Gammaproteobacteria bacterium]
MKHSKTKTSFYRRLYVAHLISVGVNTVPQITQLTGMPRRTAQDTIAALDELAIRCEFIGAKKDGGYTINDWGAINPLWIKGQISHICEVLEYPAPD